MSSLAIRPTPLEGLFTVESEPFVDDRGAFYRCFCDEQMRRVVSDCTIRQINHSRTEAVGAVRGLHFQFPPFAETKFVRCLRGRVWDVAVDLRKHSPTRFHWHAEELSADNYKMMVIPSGFAHGFQVLAHSSELLYLHTAPYERSAEGGVRFDDAMLKIAWPLDVTDLSQRDRQHAYLTDAFVGIG